MVAHPHVHETEEEANGYRYRKQLVAAYDHMVVGVETDIGANEIDDDDAYPSNKHKSERCEWPEQTGAEDLLRIEPDVASNQIDRDVPAQVLGRCEEERRASRMQY